MSQADQQVTQLGADSSSVRSPCSSNFSRATPTRSSGNGRTKPLVSEAIAQVGLSACGAAATGACSHDRDGLVGRRPGLARGARSAQSIAFFRTPGTQWLYSGVAIRRASRGRDRFFQVRHGRWVPIGLNVPVKHREFAELVWNDSHPVWRRCGCGPDEAAVIRSAPKIPCNARNVREGADCDAIRACKTSACDFSVGCAPTAGTSSPNGRRRHASQSASAREVTAIHG